jgi:hypothetical protein
VLPLGCRLGHSFGSYHLPLDANEPPMADAIVTPPSPLDSLLPSPGDMCNQVAVNPSSSVFCTIEHASKERLQASPQAVAPHVAVY